MAEENKPEAPKPRKVIQKPLNPLAMKPGQNYETTKYAPEKPYKEIEKKD
jgi:hypothetical protein